MNDDLEIVKVYYNNIEDLYPELFEEIFKCYDQKQIPALVYLVFYKKDYIGFLSAYMQNMETLYIQYAGYVDKYKGYQTLNFFREILKFIHKDYKKINCRITRDNIPALKMALSAGMKIFGIRMIENTIFVEFEKERENGTT